MNENQHQIIKAICYLKKDGDRNNCLQLTNDFLIIIIRKRKHMVHLSHIENLYVSKKKLLGLIVAGGLIFSLSTLAFFSLNYQPLLLLIVMITGLFIFFFGYDGSLAITIDSVGSSHNYFIRKTGNNIEEFLRYCRMVLPGRPNSEKFQSFYLQYPDDNIFQHSELEYSIKLIPSKRLRCYTYDEIFKGEGYQKNWLVIDPLNFPFEIRFIPHYSSLRPFVIGPFEGKFNGEIRKI